VQSGTHVKRELLQHRALMLTSRLANLCLDSEPAALRLAALAAALDNERLEHLQARPGSATSRY
jgi:hypothetical protein